MSLIECPECEGQMSDGALTCPTCGWHRGSYRPWWHWVVLGSLLLVVLVGAYAVYDADRKADKQSEELDEKRCAFLDSLGEDC